MSSTPTPSAPKAPADVVAAAEDLVASLDGMLWAARTAAELLDTVAAAERLKRHLEAVELAVVTEIDATDAAAAHGWASTRDYLDHIQGGRPGGGKATVRLAGFAQTYPRLPAALRAGRLSRAQADVIAEAVRRLPADHELRTRAVQQLLDDAEVLDTRGLRRLARRIFEVVDPDGAERELERELAREERAAYANRGLAVTEDRLGGMQLRGSGPVEDGALLRAALLPLSAPQPAGAPDEVPTEPGSADNPNQDLRDHGARMWDALVDMCRRQLNAGDLPQSHGSPVRLLVTMDLDRLAAGSGDGRTATGEALHASTVRRLACDAEVVPAVLGSEGQPLDVGRASRLVTAALFTALVVRDRHCAFPRCTRPPLMCHAHHIRHWAEGGPTNLDNLVLLCGAHHRMVHHTPWQARIGDNALPEFKPPDRDGQESRWITRRHRLE